MNDPAISFGPALAFGFALGIAPGPVQVLILSQSATRGLAGGLRVMLGANVTMFVILVAIALGVSAIEPSDAALRMLALAGGAALVAFAALELRSIHAPARAAQAAPGGLGPTTTGVVAVVLNPGAWLFFATTATATLAAANEASGRAGAVVTATAMAIGVSLADLVSTGLGSGGHRILGPRGLTALRTTLAIVLIAIGAGFVWRGLTG